MAPEQARGEAVDHRADLFSLGSVLYALCTGTPPFGGSTTLAVLRQVNDQEPASPNALNPDVPAWLEALIARLMAKDPPGRFQSAAEVAALLEGYLAHLRQPATVAAPALPSPGADRPEAPARKPIPIRRLAALLLMVALGIGLSFAWLGAGEADPARGPAQEFYQRFDDSSERAPGLKLFGIHTDQHLRFEPAGLRITLPFGYQGHRPAHGLVTSFGIKGDFEITVGFEVVGEERGPENPDRLSGLCLDVIPQRAADFDREQWIKTNQNMASVARTLEAWDRPTFLARATQWDGNSARDEVRRHELPTQARTGRLRLARTGPVLSFYAAEGAETDFILLHRESFGDSDLKYVRVIGTTANNAAQLDVRVKDLRIHAQAFTRSGPATPPKTWAKTLWLLIPVGIVVPLAVWLGVRRSGKTPAPKAQPGKPGPAEGVALAVTFACSQCGRSLKARAELAGKKVKCRHCGQVLPVPEAGSSSPQEK
jgi:hypothetical protein